MRRLWIVVLAVALVLTAVGCGSSGGSSAYPENRWDVMSWESGQWGP